MCHIANNCFSFYFALTILCSRFRYTLKKSYSMPDVFSLLMMFYCISFVVVVVVVKLHALNCTVPTTLFSFSSAHTLNEINRGKKIVYFHIIVSDVRCHVGQSVLLSFALECIRFFFDIKGRWSSMSFSPIHLFLQCLATSPSQPRLMKKVSYQLWTHSYLYAPFFSKSWATLVQLSPFLKDPAPGMAGIGSVGSRGGMKAPWGSSITLAKAFAPRRYCLRVTLVKPTSSWLSSCHCLWQTTSNSSGGIH